jgi:hypothetical protein
MSESSICARSSKYLCAAGIDVPMPATPAPMISGTPVIRPTPVARAPKATEAPSFRASVRSAVLSRLSKSTRTGLGIAQPRTKRPTPSGVPPSSRT